MSRVVNSATINAMATSNVPMHVTSLAVAIETAMSEAVTSANRELRLLLKLRPLRPLAKRQRRILCPMAHLAQEQNRRKREHPRKQMLPHQ